jgi:hypothetical protein
MLIAPSAIRPLPDEVIVPPGWARRGSVRVLDKDLVEVFWALAVVWDLGASPLGHRPYGGDGLVEDGALNHLPTPWRF